MDSANSFLLQPFVNYNLAEGIDLALHQSGLCRKALMSAYGYKRTCGGVSRRVRFTRESRHSEVQERLGLKKRTLRVTEFMSAYDPKRSSPYCKNTCRRSKLVVVDTALTHPTGYEQRFVYGAARFPSKFYDGDPVMHSRYPNRSSRFPLHSLSVSTRFASLIGRDKAIAITHGLAIPRYTAIELSVMQD